MKISIALVLFIAFVLSGCKHDYPSDIPKWLKNRITKIKRSQDHGCHDGCGITVDELTETTTGAKIYSITDCFGPDAYTYYDQSGNELCNITMPGQCYDPVNSCPCGNYTITHFKYTKRIWKAEHCD